MEALVLQENNIPVWHKVTLSIEEAAAYSGIGINKLRQLSDSEDCEFVLWVGSHKKIKRQKLDKFLSDNYSI